MRALLDAEGIPHEANKTRLDLGDGVYQTRIDVRVPYGDGEWESVKPFYVAG